MIYHVLVDLGNMTFLYLNQLRFLAVLPNSPNLSGQPGEIEYQKITIVLND